MKLVLFTFLFVSSSLSFAISPATSPELILVPDNLKACKADTDCQLINTLCGCCDLATINKNHIKAYLKMEKQCKEPPPPCDCPEPNAIAKCTKGICTNTK